MTDVIREFATNNAGLLGVLCILGLVLAMLSVLAPVE